jgi:hypothetical protein
MEISEDEEVVQEGDGLTLTELNKILGQKWAAILPIKQLVSDFIRAEHPTALQLNVAKMFGKDTTAMLQEVERDLLENWREYYTI